MSENDDKTEKTGATGADSASEPKAGAAPEQSGAAAAAGDAAAQGQAQPQAAMLAQYVKDLSFENPNAPAILQTVAQAQTPPKMDVNVGINARRTGEETYECELKLTVTSKIDETTVFAVEVVYAGLFGIRNLPDEVLEPFLLVQAPHLLFPFARRVIADAVRDGGFAPLLLEPIDFAALYQQQRAQQQAGTPGGTGAIDLGEPPAGNA
ncbi:MAG: protein-export chaperone SecB [Alphaproteobacteria bacterium]|nr:MAG: protein-export chaperone SecB [Alphaproteobacteria bacterium]